MADINGARQTAQPARDLFEALSPAVVQLRVIDRASGDKSTIGSGFQVDAGGRIVSNYHVVSEYVNAPQRFRLEYVDAAGRRGSLSLLDIDVIHDIALLWTSTPLPVSLRLGSSQIDQGERIYSLGNPLDLALTIIEGTFNGFIESSRFERILFSATLNPGMSGGPALDREGRVMGINVAHGAEQISFLVPVEALADLLQRQTRQGQAQSVDQRITDSLFAEQQEYYQRLVNERWQVQRFGDFMLPWHLSPTLNCWGGSQQQANARYQHVYQECESADSIFLDYSFETGRLRYSYDWFASRELSQMQFFTLLERQFHHAEQFHQIDRERVGPFRCKQGFIAVAGLDWRLSWCVRGYRRYPGLQDLSVVLGTADLRDRGLVVSLSATGIGSASAQLFLRRFLGAFEWLD